MADARSAQLIAGREASAMANQIMLRWLSGRVKRHGPLAEDVLKRITQRKNELLCRHGIELAGLDPNSAYVRLRKLFEPDADVIAGDKPGALDG